MLSMIPQVASRLQETRSLRSFCWPVPPPFSGPWRSSGLQTNDKAGACVLIAMPSLTLRRAMRRRRDSNPLNLGFKNKRVLMPLVPKLYSLLMISLIP